MELDPQAFEGTAEFYSIGRPPYSSQLADTLARQVSLDATGQLLDVGCGPGVLELELAQLFTQVVALDPEIGMLQTGQSRCQQAAITNVRWVQGVAEDLAALNIGPCRVVTFGLSFHRVRQREVAEAVFDLLLPGGALVLVSHQVAGRPRPPQPAYPEIPHAAIMDLVIGYLGKQARDYLAVWDPPPTARFEDTLRETRFGESRVVYAPGRPDLIRNADDVVANCFSMSYSAPRLFGSRRAAFEADLRRLLHVHSPDGLFWDWPGDTELVLATKV